MIKELTPKHLVPFRGPLSLIVVTYIYIQFLVSGPQTSGLFCHSFYQYYSRLCYPFYYCLAFTHSDQLVPPVCHTYQPTRSSCLSTLLCSASSLRFSTKRYAQSFILRASILGKTSIMACNSINGIIKLLNDNNLILLKFCKRRAQSFIFFKIEKVKKKTSR